MSATTFTRARVRNLLVAILIPLALIATYFASLGGASADSGRIPAMLVNNDEMVTQANKDGTTTPVVAGRLLVSWLTNPDNAGEFNWTLATAETAQAALDRGDAFVAVTIPKDFSASVVSVGTGSPRSARMEVVTDQAHDYLTGAVSQQLFEGLGAEFGQTLTHQIAVGLADGMNESAQGLQQAADGAHDLATGAGKLGEGFDQYADGITQLADGADQSAAGAGALTDGVSQFGDGVHQYVDGVGQYVDGAGTLAGGVAQYVDGVGGYVSGVDQYVSGVDAYTSGVDEFAGGVVALDDGMQQLKSGAAQLGGAATQLGEVAGQVSQYSDQIEAAASAMTQLKDFLAQLDGLDPAQLQQFCTALEAVDPAQATACTSAVDDLVAQLTASGVDLPTILAGLDSASTQIGELAGAGTQLDQLATGLKDFTGGVSQAADGSAQLADGAQAIIDGGAQVRDGGAQLTSGGSQLTGGGTDLVSGANQLAASGGELTSGGDALASGATDLTSGASQLSTGLNELAAGAGTLADNSAPIKDGITQLGDGASTMSKALQDGADQAKTAIADPDGFADVVAEPLTVATTQVHDPGFGGVLTSLLLPAGIWLAACITALRRRLVTRDLLDSSASNPAILLTATRKLAAPVFIVAGVLSLLAHLLAGAPWIALGGTLLVAALAAVVAVAVHLLLAVLWGRRDAAIASIALLLVQGLAVGGFLPMALRAGWSTALAVLAPLHHEAAAFQSLYAGGPASVLLVAAIALLLMTAAALAVAAVALARKRRANVAGVLAAAGSAQPRRG